MNSLLWPFIEHRRTPRILVKGGLASVPSLADGESVDGDAALLDLSLQGCQLEAEQRLPTDQPYQIVVWVPPHPSPIVIPKAMTRWSQGQIQGIAFLDLPPSAKVKLNKVVQQNPASSWVLSAIRFNTPPTSPPLTGRTPV